MLGKFVQKAARQSGLYCFVTYHIRFLYAWTVRGAAGAAPRLHCYAPQKHGAARGFLITIKANVVDTHFARLKTIHYLLKAPVFDLQSITD
jgi:hypothetical protein